MVVNIIVAGELQCEMFAQACLVADYLTQNLPSLRYEKIEISASEWKTWLPKINRKYKWHHCTSPLIWKEVLIQGSKAYYIGGVSEFWDYCHSYYKFSTFISIEKLDGLVQNISKFKKNISAERQAIKCTAEIEVDRKSNDMQSHEDEFNVCISGASCLLAKNLISGLLDATVGEKRISKIYLHDNHDCSQDNLMFFTEFESSFVNSEKTCKKVVKYIDRLGMALTQTNLLIIMEHIPFNVEQSIGDWLYTNRNLMEEYAYMINASANPDLAVMLPNLGPACYNATILRDNISSINKKNIVVATSDLGLEITSVLAEVARVPLENVFCPPVWGFVGINNLVDVRTTVHKYNTFNPYKRYIKVKDSTLTIGSLKPEMRTMEYLMNSDDSLWKKVSERKEKVRDVEVNLSKVVAMLNLIKMWFLTPNPKNIVSLGVTCDGSFGLNFNGIFSQPAHLVNGFWVPASDYNMIPRDPQMKLSYLQYIAEVVMKLEPNSLPRLESSLFWIKMKPKFSKKKVNVISRLSSR